MRIERVWAMPNKHTFLIKPITRLLEEEMVSGIFWVDPFAGENSPATLRNDLNFSVANVEFHKEAFEFLEGFEDSSIDGVLFDPPYNLSQARQCYESIGVPKKQDLNNYLFCHEKDKAAKIVRTGGKAISFGWSSMGFGVKRGFEITRILLVPHGGMHYDTIVTVEKKVG